MHLEPHISFGPHPDLGVVAEVAVGNPHTEQVLRKYHFRQHPESGLYFLPRDAPYNRVLRAATGAARVLQDAGLSVATDPRLMVPPPVPQSPGTPARHAVPAQSLTALTAELHAVDRAMDAAEILQELLDEDFGAMGELEQLISATATWCERLDTDAGRELGSRLHTIANHVAFLGYRIADVEGDLAVMPEVIPADAPPLAATPARPYEDFLPRYGARAQAAVAASPHRPGHSPIPPSPVAAPPPPGPARTR
ncbi:hypothetical protein F9278_27920 [Streptomyces phaeolivaceus]|uniref:Uncharacterized protein n=1 Tax=Streptomyces phaeolivaceus TaxID=2653200 RepID=A0A5P8K943_9ACTN|nr:hypothetical protein [Streptomyces phaeolivaceus]QFQ99342.1 hypothetical protein F9278_27920 [Streptomyces phaeolivaceus]